MERHLSRILENELEETTQHQALYRGVDIILPGKDGLRVEMESRKLRLYLGIDATSPNLHIGHTVPLRKLRHFQELGHEVILLFGGFTSLIGDPSDKSAVRIRLTSEQVEQNMATYVDQARKIVDLSSDCPNPITILNNNEWLSKLTLAEFIDIQANFTVQQMLQRKMFQERIEREKPIWLQEFSYPLMQGWDAVAMDVDLEIGGKDQLFNMLIGQTLLRRYKHHEKWVLGTKLIEDPAGKKMGKTEGDIVNILDWPEVKYESIMTWPDSAIGVGFELITSVPLVTVKQIQKEILPSILEGSSKIHPMELKESLAFRTVSELDGFENAEYARDEFDRVKRKGELPRRIHEIFVEPGTYLSEVLVLAGWYQQKEESARVVASGSIFKDGKKVDKDFKITDDGDVLSIGKRTIGKIRRIRLL
ncbi:MAG: Tyrosyl-tRNA synthetase TyrS [Candidatus Woesebacteria bacterium GW2011_GWB1_39_10b]|uniref:Tyrosine--tRNA ligase n=2 Tax=Candidatus Woeseibacteriota TaxID=1752722 RepID=A0A0G0RKZ7_9BACT|nr:MAG: hypothetical protein US72_C0007G0035 [Microgenomates group bacterium GW2011_GWC1_38_12]KKQ93764.1 MAG: Tyrosyl-tRNA synthetase TyrS [Candidatus Woesebacteria bacterium GW2011_GWB1_39_10b]KKR14327.1 MAG: Tyrosyl-tRNA synthetase TyrS [Candidatus Woesebacteria bacterium GW2011_GWA1_39_21b]